MPGDYFHSLQWFCIHDPVAVQHHSAPVVGGLKDRGILGQRYDTPYLGQQTILCCRPAYFDRGNRVPPRYFSYDVQVADGYSILAPQYIDVNNENHDPVIYLAEKKRELKAYKDGMKDPINVIDDDKREESEKENERIEKAIDILTDYLEGSEGKTLHRLKVHAAHLNGRDILDNGEMGTVLRAVVYRKSGSSLNGGEQTWRIIHWTDCSIEGMCGRYDGSGNTAQSAIQAALVTWSKDSKMPASTIAYHLTFNDGDSYVNLNGSMRTRGLSSWDVIIHQLSLASMAAMGVALLFAPLPCARLASAAIWTSIGTGITASTISIAQRYDRGFSNWRDDSLDVLGIVGCLLVGSSLVRGKLLVNAGSASQLKVGEYIILSQIGTEVASGVILTADAVNQIADIQANGRLTIQEKTRRIGDVITGFLSVMLMTAAGGLPTRQSGTTTKNNIHSHEGTGTHTDRSTNTSNREHNHNTNNDKNNARDDNSLDEPTLQNTDKQHDSELEFGTFNLKTDEIDVNQLQSTVVIEDISVVQHTHTGKGEHVDKAEQVVLDREVQGFNSKNIVADKVRAASGPIEPVMIRLDDGTVIAARQGNSLTFVDDLDLFRTNSAVGNTGNRLDIVTHGSPGSVVVGGESVSGTQLGDALIRSGQLDEFSKIKLFSCSTGCELENLANFAQSLANKTRLPVSAPNRDLITVPNGKIYIADDLKFDVELNQWVPVNEGQFIDFFPK